MHNIEEKGAVSTNGIGLSNGLSNKETDDTWADLNKAIDNEINGCSEGANDKPSINDKQSTIQKNDVISETSSNSGNDKPDKTINDLDCSDKEVGNKPGNELKRSNHEGLNEKDIELPLVDDDVSSENKTGNNKMTNETNSSMETTETSEVTDKSKALSHPTETSSNGISSSCDSSKVMKEELDRSKVLEKDTDKKDPEVLTDSKSVKTEKAKSEDVILEQESKEGLSKITSAFNKNEKHTEDLNYDSALQELSDITKYAKELDDDHSAGTTSTISSSSNNVEQTQKRKLDDELSNDSPTSLKRTKVDNQAKLDKISNDTDVATKAIKKQLKRISRTEMEDLVARKVVEVISCRSEIGDLRAKCDKYEEMNDKWKRKTQALQKMCQDLNTVIKRYIVDVKNKKDNPTPIKITRSVGLQVCADSRRRATVPPQQSTASAQTSKQVTSQKISAPTNTQKRMVSGNQAPNTLKGPMTNSLPNVGNSTSPNDSNKSSKPLQNTVTTPVSSITSNAGNRVMQSLPQHPLINRSPVNNQKGTPIATPMATPSSGTKGYLCTPQGVVLQSTPAAVVTAASSQIGNSSSVRTTLPTPSQSPGVAQQASTNSVSTNAQSNITSNKTHVGTSNSSGLATATAASNKVIDLVELSDEEDGPPNPPLQSQPKPSLPVQRSQQQTNANNRNGLGPNPGFPNQLPQHKPHSNKIPCSHSLISIVLRTSFRFYCKQTFIVKVDINHDLFCFVNVTIVSIFFLIQASICQNTPYCF